MEDPLYHQARAQSGTNAELIARYYPSPLIQLSIYTHNKAHYSRKASNYNNVLLPIQEGYKML
jgi:hypothetical protein